jgi:hypothetical protein
MRIYIYIYIFCFFLSFCPVKWIPKKGLQPRSLNFQRIRFIQFFHCIPLKIGLTDFLQVGSALGKMVRGVNWGNLDILVVDMPPGTGDAQIAISQLLRLSGS